MAAAAHQSSGRRKVSSCGEGGGRGGELIGLAGSGGNGGGAECFGSTQRTVMVMGPSASMESASVSREAVSRASRAYRSGRSRRNVLSIVAPCFIQSIISRSRICIACADSLFLLPGLRPWRGAVAGNDTLSGGTDADKFVFDTALNALANVDERCLTVTAFFEWIPAAARIYIVRYNVPAG